MKTLWFVFGVLFFFDLKTALADVSAPIIMECRGGRIPFLGRKLSVTTQKFITAPALSEKDKPVPAPKAPINADSALPDVDPFANGVPVDETPPAPAAAPVDPTYPTEAPADAYVFSHLDNIQYDAVSGRCSAELVASPKTQRMMGARAPKVHIDFKLKKKSGPAAFFNVVQNGKSFPARGRCRIPEILRAKCADQEKNPTRGSRPKLWFHEVDEKGKVTALPPITMHKPETINWWVELKEGIFGQKKPKPSKPNAKKKSAAGSLK